MPPRASSLAALLPAGFAAAAGLTLADQTAAIFPIAHLAKLPPGEYRAQAVFHSNRDLNLHDAPGNLYSDPVSVKLDPARGGTFKLELTRRVPDEKPPAETEHVKYVKL